MYHARELLVVLVTFHGHHDSATHSKTKRVVVPLLKQFSTTNSLTQLGSSEIYLKMCYHTRIFKRFC